MKTTNVIIVCITAIICTALLAFAAVKRSHHKWHKGWECHGGGPGFRGEHGGYNHEGARWQEKGEHGFEGHRGGFGRDFDPKEMAERQTERMKEGLSLKEDQVSKVEAINLKYAEKRKATMEGIKGQMETMHAEKIKELSAVLDKEQLAKFEQFTKNREEHGGFGEHHSMQEEQK